MKANAPIIDGFPSSGTFIRLAGAVSRFRKEVLRVWKGVDPNTGKPLEFTKPFLEQLAKNTNEWIRLGHDVYAPDGHTDKAMDNLGRWTGFEVEGDRLYGTFEPADEQVASKIGSRIRGVSIYARGPVLTSSGSTLSCAILHVCLTPCPVLPNQQDFIALALAACQETKMSDDAKTTDIKLAANTADDDGAKPPAEGSEMSQKEFMLKAEALLGITDASWDDLFNALRALVVDEAGETAAAPGAQVGAANMAPTIMAMLARREKAIESKLAQRFAKDLEAVRAQSKSSREAHAQELVALSRKRAADSGVIFDKEASELALSLLSSESEREQKAGRALLAQHDKLAEGAIKLAQSGRRLVPEAEVKAKAAITESDSAASFILGQDFDSKKRTIRAN